MHENEDEIIYFLFKEKSIENGNKNLKHFYVCHIYPFVQQ